MERQAIISRVSPYTKSHGTRLLSMIEAISTVDKEGIIGDVVECGVWRGGNVMLARIMSPLRSCWLYDTFDGMTEPDREKDITKSGKKAIDKYNAKINNGHKWNAVPLLEVSNAFEELGINGKGVNFVAGPVEETLYHSTMPQPQSIAILRLDVDWYAPTKASLEVLYPKLNRGGFLIVDDYGHWLGCKKAVDDYFKDQAPFHRDVDYSCRVYRK